MNLVIKFTDSSKSFTYGVEYGRLLEKMERGDEAIVNNGFPVRIENQDVIKTTCEYYGYLPTFGQPKDGWIDFIGIKKTSDN